MFKCILQYYIYMHVWSMEYVRACVYFIYFPSYLIKITEFFPNLFLCDMFVNWYVVMKWKNPRTDVRIIDKIRKIPITMAENMHIDFDPTESRICRWKLGRKKVEKNRERERAYIQCTFGNDSSEFITGYWCTRWKASDTQFWAHSHKVPKKMPRFYVPLSQWRGK